ncbi:MAG: BTAD domain-containing putative transcriptional regulator [Acidimicrobiales bacterium]|nr:BTAD domain-containing putative transcriptional regulator [Acidimicrobiales bacterium]
MIEVSVLGRVEAHVDGRRIEITSRTQRILLAALAHARGATVPTDRLIWFVWGDDPPDRARPSLKSHLSRLRRTLRDDVVVSRPPGYVLTIDPEHLDLHRFEQGMYADSLPELDEALALWRGEPFGELGDHEHLAGEVARLTELHLAARVRRAELLADAGRHAEAISELRSLAAERPLLERARVALVATLHRAGRQADAIAEADRYRAQVADVGLEPSSAFVATERAVFAEPSPPPPTPAVRSTPPARVGSLVGRDDEIDHICGLLAERRLVTMVGPGGVGKTALAIEVTRRMVDLVPDGVWIAELTEVEDDAGVLPTVVRAVGAPTTNPMEVSLAGYLSGRDGLVVLDNTEHVTSTAGAIADRILAAAGGIRILTTSRRPLGLAGEVVVAVDPLTIDAALRLLEERCRDAGATIEPHQIDLATRICERLDRLPLAIEMAAARLRALSLEDLDRHLDQRLRLLRSGRDGRHETLEDVVAWSSDLLDPDQRGLFEHLAVFAGPFDLDAAMAVHGSEHTAGLLADLVDRSLVQTRNDMGSVRYQMLETVRSFASERLEESPTRDATLDRFIRHHVALAEQVAEGLRGPDERRWTDLFDLSTPNFEVAHARALERGDIDAAVRIAAATYVLVYQRLRGDIGAWAEATLEPARRTDHPATATVLAICALDRINRGLHEEAAALLTDLPDDPVAAHAHETLGDLYTYQGELAAAVEHFALAAELALAGGDQTTAAHARMSQAVALGYAGHRDEALSKLRWARSTGERVGAGFVSAWCDYAEAELLVDMDPARSLELVDQAVAAADREGWRMLAGVGRLTASSLRARSAEPSDAIAGFDRLIRHWDRLGDTNHQWTTLRNLVELLVRLDDPERAAQVLGAVTNSPRPTFGLEEERMRGAEATIRATLGTRADELVEQGAILDLDATIGLALEALAELGSKENAAPE